MSEVLFEVLDIRVTVTGVAAAASVLTLILYTALWLLGRKKRTGLPVFAGQVMNGVGFGLLPAVAVLKAFLETGSGNGAKVTEPLLLVRWLSTDGFFRPGRIEIAAAAACFMLVCLWLMIRKQELPDNGDLLLTALCLWAAIRLVTEDFRAEPHFLFHCTSFATILGCLTIWVIRQATISRSPVRMVLNLAAVGGCAAVNLLTSAGVLSAGSEIGDFAVKTGSALLALLLTLIAGSDLRRMQRRTEHQPG